MSERPHEIKTAFVDGMGPSSYKRWRATMLGQVTEALEQRLVLELIGPSHDKRVLDLGCGDGVLTSRIAAHGASAVGIDVDDSMLRAATDTIEPGAIGIPTFVRGRIEALPFVDDSIDVIIAVTVLCLVVAATKKPAEPAEENAARLRRGKFPHQRETLRSGSPRAKQ